MTSLKNVTLDSLNNLAWSDGDGRFGSIICYNYAQLAKDGIGRPIVRRLVGVFGMCVGKNGLHERSHRNTPFR